MLIAYVALVHKASEDAANYGVFFPDFPGCISAGSTVEKALENAREGLVFHMEGLLENKQRLPKPMSLEKIMTDPENKECMPCLIHLVPPSGRSKRINVSIDIGLLAEIDRALCLFGKNRSEFLAWAARQVLA